MAETRPPFPRLALLLVASLVASTLPLGVAAGSAPPGTYSTRPTEGVRDLQQSWIGSTIRDLGNDSREWNFSRDVRENLTEKVNSSIQQWRQDRWRTSVRTLISVRTDATVLRIEKQANGSDDPSQVWLNETGVIATSGFSRLSALRTRVTDLANNTTDPERMEVLLLASTLVVDGMENVRIYPQSRRIVQTSGNQTPGPALRQLTASAVSARWDARWASDLLDLAEDMGGPGEGEDRVDPDALPEAWRTMEATLDLSPPRSTVQRGLHQGINSTTEEGEWLLSLTLGHAYGTVTRSQAIQQDLQDRATSPAELEDRMRDDARDLGPVVPLLEAGYRAVLQTGAIQDAEAFLVSEDTGLQELARTLARLERVPALSEAMEVLAVGPEEGNDTGPNATGGDGSPLVPAAAGLVAGALLGAGGALLVARRRP